MRGLLVIAMVGLGVGAVAATTDTVVTSPAPVPELGRAIDQYRAIAARGGWPIVADGPTLHPGERSPIVATLRARLGVTGDLTGDGAFPETALPPPPTDLYDPTLVEAVQAFQDRHGLGRDGVIGPRTRAALNVPVQDRIDQLVLAAERTRRRDAPHARRYVRVNIPAYSLELIEDGRAVLDMPVVVGRPDRATPEMTSTMNFLVINPPWTIPTKLAYEDILPKARRDPHYFRAHDITVFAGWRGDAEAIDPDWIDWGLIGSGIKGLKLRQAPGPENPLGRIKFHMANAFDVYLHDTSSHGLMARADRALSSGCIRVGNARALAAAVLAGNPDWSPDRIDEVIASRVTTKIHLRVPVPVQLFYQTAWVTADGRVHFRNDIYRSDRRYAAELASSEPPRAEPIGSATPHVGQGPALHD